MPLFKLSETGIADQDNMVVPDIDKEELFNDTELSDYKKDKKEEEDKGMVINKYEPYKKMNDFSQKNDTAKFHEDFVAIVNEYFDYHDVKTNMAIFALDEAEQNALIVSLTNKLYQMMIDKVDEVDYGDIPNSKGDITRLPKYEQIEQCIEILKQIFTQYKEDTKPIIEIQNALQYVEYNKDLFMACFAGKISLGIAMYNNIVLGIIASISYMIATCIEYIKSPKNDGMDIALDKAGISKVKESLMYESLVKFNDAARKGDVENALKPLIKSKAKGFEPLSVLIGVGAIVSVVGVVLACVSMLKDLVYYFYASRARVSTYLDIQADLLEMNANQLNSSKDIRTVGDKSSVVRRQLKIASAFRKLADKIAIDHNKNERAATNQIKADSKKYRIDDVNTNPDTAMSSTGGPLF